MVLIILIGVISGCSYRISTHEKVTCNPWVPHVGWDGIQERNMWKSFEGTTMGARCSYDFL